MRTWPARAGWLLAGEPQTAAWKGLRYPVPLLACQQCRTKHCWASQQWYPPPQLAVLLWLLAALWCVPALAQLPADPSPARDDAAIYRRIEQLRRAAAKLRLDGFDTDWKPFPQFSDPQGDADGDGPRDLVAAAIAPTDSDLWVMLRTAAAPSADPLAFYVRIDLFGDRGYRLRVEWLAGGETLSVRLLDERGQPGPAMPMRRSRLAMRRCIELRIPYSDLAAALPEDLAKLVSGDSARPWVRVACNSWNARQLKMCDHGPAVGSFRLLPTPYPLDAPLPERPRPPIAMPLPVNGPWLVMQGSHGSFSHQGVWACDLVRVDAVGNCSQPVDSKKVEDYLAWGQPVFAPVDGRVLRAVGQVDDSPTFGRLTAGAPCNEILLATAQGCDLNLIHLRKDSLLVRQGELVRAGQPLAAVGNSGASDAPHLHLALWTTAASPARTAPLALRNVRVGLNLSADDPWARDLPAWEPRPGYLVERLPER